MIKYAFILLNFTGIMLFSRLGDQQISVQLDTPEQVNAGESFTVNIVIDKGEIESFSRFIQELPYGLTAERISTANADFSFDNQRIRMIWLKLPPDRQITVSYKIHVHERLKGTFRLRGTFAFIEENERQIIDIESAHDITIIPDAQISGDLIVDIDDFEKVLLAERIQQAETEELTVIRKEPVQTGQHQYRVDLMVKKKDLNKFAKIEEYISPGFRAVEGDSRGGIFSFNNGTAKILWMNLPEESTFQISYYIIPDPDRSMEDLSLSGSFSYIDDNQTQSIAILENNSHLAQAEPEEEEVAKMNSTNEAEHNHESVEELPEKQEESPAVNPSAVETRIIEEQKTGEGIFYRVQLAAGHQPVKINSYFSKLNIQQNVTMEFHEGWRKYTIGPYPVYREARDVRNRVWKTTPIDGAFVTAYNSGERITVQEALMIANHKWYP